jgi:hypothetical protein
LFSIIGEPQIAGLICLNLVLVELRLTQGSILAGIWAMASNWVIGVGASPLPFDFRQCYDFDLIAACYDL